MSKTTLISPAAARDLTPEGVLDVVAGFGLRDLKLVPATVAGGGETLEWAHPAATPAEPPFAEPTCTACGCTEHNACVHMPTGGSCKWAALDLTNNAGTCTACAE